MDFLVVSPQSPYQKEFRSFLKLLEGVELNIVSGLENAKTQIYYKKPHVLVVHLSQVTEKSFQGIEQIRSPLDIPVIIMTNRVTENSLKLAKKYKRYYVLGRPYLSRDLLGVAFKMTHGEVPEQQLCRRYTTDQRTALQVVGEMDNFDARITNLSLTGAKIHFDDLGKGWAEGDLIKMDVALDKIKRNHSMHAKVVWVEKDTPGEIGVEFIPTEDVYSHLLSNV